MQVDQAVKEHRSAGSTGIGGFFARRRRRSRSGSVNSTSSASEVSDALALALEALQTHRIGHGVARLWDGPWLVEGGWGASRALDAW